jgi:hypothetical protein
MNGTMDVVMRRIPNAISIPARALFTRHGRAIVYTAHAGRYEPVEVKVVARNPDEVAVEGIRQGSTVALVEPGVGTTAPDAGPGSPQAEARDRNGP